MAHWNNKHGYPRIKPVSDKRQTQLDEYKIKRINFLLDHPICQVGDCLEAATDIHHMRGRSGKQLNEVSDFLGTCREDHVYIEEHPDWARAKGYTRSRLHG